MDLLGMHGVSAGFGGPPLLDRIDLRVEQGERICILGRNGEGKTTLLRLIHGQLEPDDGAIERSPGLTTALVDQEVPGKLEGTILDVVIGGALPSRVQQKDGTDQPAAGDWQIRKSTDRIISRMNLDPAAEVSVLSAGLKRRVLIARALAAEPGILLLDEPTNHLDIEAITWIEEFLARYEGTLFFVTHDRIFLQKLATRIVHLDRGRLTSWNCDYPTFLRRSQAELEAEARRNALFDKRLAVEETWIRKGIQARRTRNEGRVRDLKRMREERRARREQAGRVRMEAHQAERTGRKVIMAEKISYDWEGKTVIDSLTTTIMRGDRVGIIGPNGSGKTTLLKVLLHELEPRSGSVRHGTNLEAAYFDQLRERLDENETVQDNVSGGSSTVVINGKTRHILGYLQDFLFPPERARSPIGWLSGGERNRLLLAKLFTLPSNVLVLDEPTNDLDVETLELLEELLLDYRGTVLLVSHDRALLNNVVTSTLVLEGEGRISEYVGGYDDWVRQRPPVAVAAEPAKKTSAGKGRQKRQSPSARRRLTYREQQELIALPERIEALETEQASLHQAMADPAFYKKEESAIAEANSRLKEVEKELAAAYKRWEELEL